MPAAGQFFRIQTLRMHIYGNSIAPFTHYGLEKTSGLSILLIGGSVLPHFTQHIALGLPHLMESGWIIIVFYGCVALFLH